MYKKYLSQVYLSTKLPCLRARNALGEDKQRQLLISNGVPLLPLLSSLAVVYHVNGLSTQGLLSEFTLWTSSIIYFSENIIETKKNFFLCLYVALMHAAIFGNVAAIIQKLYANRVRYHSRANEIKQFIRVHRIEQDLANRLEDYFHTTWSLSGGVDTSEVRKKSNLKNIQERKIVLVQLLTQDFFEITISIWPKELTLTYLFYSKVSDLLTHGVWRLNLPHINVVVQFFRELFLLCFKLVIVY